MEPAVAFPPDPYLPAPAPAPAPAADPAKSPAALAAKFGTPVLASGYCEACETTIDVPVWCFRQGKNMVEVWHLVENGHATAAEVSALIAAFDKTPGP
jgi:hypothetical protein